jgi:hypothetical protein
MDVSRKGKRRKLRGNGKFYLKGKRTKPITCILAMA